MQDRCFCRLITLWSVLHLLLLVLLLWRVLLLSRFSLWGLFRWLVRFVWNLLSWLLLLFRAVLHAAARVATEGVAHIFIEVVTLALACAHCLLLHHLVHLGHLRLWLATI